MSIKKSHFSPSPMKSGLYIHVPFCLSKCGYCSFYSVASPQLIPEFVKAVVREMTFYPGAFPAFDTIYIGGGTPSLLSVHQLEDILAAARLHFKIDDPSEITIEVNPGDVSREYFRSLRYLGINRINIGVQSFDQDILKFLGRRHTAKEAEIAVDAVRKASFDNVGADLIYGVYGQTMKTWNDTLDKALSFFPEHLSCYQLSLDTKTPLAAHYIREGLQMPPEDEALDYFTATSRRLTDAGYIHYEVSNFASGPSRQSRHNMKYWCHAPYLGLGPAAHSFIDRKRWWNKMDVKLYIREILQGKKPVDQSEELSMEQLAMEALFLGLRTADGIDFKKYKTRYEKDLMADKKQVIDELVKNKLVELEDDCLRPTLQGMAVADSLALI